MGLFDKLKDPVFLKDDSEANRQLAALQELHKKATGELAEKIDEEINRVNAGIWGEQTVRFELQNSHIPMYILHDLYSSTVQDPGISFFHQWQRRNRKDCTGVGCICASEIMRHIFGSA
jgi:hypothetical protein